MTEQRLFHSAHYNIIAARFKEQINKLDAANSGTEAERLAYSAAKIATKHLAVALADRFEQDNPNFDRAKFLDSCGGFSE